VYIYIYITLLAIHLSVHTWGCFHILATVNNAAMIMEAEIPFVVVNLFPWNLCPEEELLCYMIVPSLIF
jgi:hypothetical protein